MSTGSYNSFKDRLYVNSDEKLSRRITEDVKSEIFGLVGELYRHCGSLGVFPKSLAPGVWDNLKCPSKDRINTSASKKELCDFAEKACHLLVERCYPLLDHLSIDVEEYERRIIQCQEELITAQRSLVEAQERLVKLQCQLLEKRDEEISAVQSTAEQEIKSFSSVLARECDTALAPQRIRTAISTATEDRLCNLVGYGLEDSKEEQESDLKTKMGHMMKSWEFEMTEIKSCYRLGRFVDGTNRPVKLVFKNSDTRRFVLENKSRLRRNETFGRVYLAPDRTPEERAARRTLVEELKGKRAEFPDKTFFIRGGKVEESVVGDQ
jgi:hypothetical protein